MGVKQGVDYTKDEIIKEIYECAMTVFGHGIAVPSNNGIHHPCGWDWIDFSDVNYQNKNINILNYRFDKYDISNRHGSLEFEGLTLKEILMMTEGKFLFEINCNVNWEE